MACGVGAQRARAEGPTSQPVKGEESKISRLLANLGDPDSETRDAARAGMMRLNREDLPELRKAVEKSRPLLPSQAAVLRQIVREIYLAEEKYEPDKSGFLGIMMDISAVMQADFVPDNDGPDSPLGVIVSDRIPGFCASRVILDGDVILGLSNPFTPFHRSDDLRAVISGLSPGATVRLLVLRRGQVIEVPLKLDAHPKNILSTDQVPPFQAERERKFEQYWQREFEPVVRRRVG